MAECPICLENIAGHDKIGRVHRCHHQYHHQCILQWSSHSNSCPTCRKLYYSIDVVSNNTVVQTVQVKDRLIENDAINQIPSEYIIPARTYTEETRTEDLNGVCTICSSAQYSRRSLLCCIGCGAKFHMLCLGRTDELMWFCPVCDCPQEFVRNQYRRTRPAISRRRLLIFNESNEIEDFDEENTTRSMVLNGGILSRREARARQNLSPEEAKSWEMFEQARTGTLAAVPTVSELQPETRKRRKRRVPTELTLLSDSKSIRSTDTLVPLVTDTLDADIMSTSTTLNNGIIQNENTKDNVLHSINVSADAHTVGNAVTADSDTGISSANTATNKDGQVSRIASLMNQIRRPRYAQAHLPLSSASLHVADSDSDVESKRTYKYELTLEQKRKIQRHVRTHLRPLYDPRLLEPGYIRTEAEYIDVNKNISRRVYAAILDHCGRNPRILEEYFDDETRLKLLVADTWRAGPSTSET